MGRANPRYHPHSDEPFVLSALNYFIFATPMVKFTHKVPYALPAKVRISEKNNLVVTKTFSTSFSLIITYPFFKVNNLAIRISFNFFSASNLY